MDDIRKIIAVGRIGSGTFGTIFKAVSPDSGKEYALKKQRFTPGVIKKLEIDVHFRGNPNFIAKAYFTGRFQGDFYILEDLFPGDLERFPHGSSLDLVTYVTHQMGRCISYLHDIKIIHKDIKPQNFLLSREYQVRLTDFGLSIKDGCQDGSSGTPIYMPLDALLGTVSTSTDWYSFGLCIWFLLMGTHLQLAETMQELHGLLRGNCVQTRLKNLRPSCMRSYVSRFLRKASNDRPTYESSLRYQPDCMKTTAEWTNCVCVDNNIVQPLEFGAVVPIQPEKMLDKDFKIDEYFRFSGMNAARFRPREKGRFIKEDTIPMYHKPPRSKNFRKFKPIEDRVYDFRSFQNPEIVLGVIVGMASSEFDYISVKSEEGELFYLSFKEVSRIPKLAEAVATVEADKRRHDVARLNICIKFIVQEADSKGIPDAPGNDEPRKWTKTDKEVHQPALDKSIDEFTMRLSNDDTKELIQAQKGANWLGMKSLSNRISKEINRRSEGQ
ncbi:unnamed protein product [Allacma fusca]|uniref:Protein kinase domain-containing protein n=1 Tax=Allacma fusca TaxID=39272 RepID=A0A8J2PMH2_9HEXA|nr:unnamed protein product [Allacma fusca]